VYRLAALHAEWCHYAPEHTLHSLMRRRTVLVDLTGSDTGVCEVQQCVWIFQQHICVDQKQAVRGLR
jgi:hypothetical protein